MASCDEAKYFQKTGVSKATQLRFLKREQNNRLGNVEDEKSERARMGAFHEVCKVFSPPSTEGTLRTSVR